MAAGMTPIIIIIILKYGYNILGGNFAYFYHLGQVTQQVLLLVELPLRLVVDHVGIHLLRWPGNPQIRDLQGGHN